MLKRAWTGYAVSQVTKGDGDCWYCTAGWICCSVKKKEEEEEKEVGVLGQYSSSSLRIREPSGQRKICLSNLDAVQFASLSRSRK